MQNAAEAVIITKRLSKAFKKTRAVEELDLTVERGEIFGLVGPDGAGKTTIIRMLTSIMLPTSGHATVLGHDTVRESEAIKTDIGYMAQRFNLYRDLTVWENLNFFADVFQVAGAARRERTSRLLEFARLSEFKTRRADHLSGGMQKKLALACTLIHEPQIIFLDEPTTGVDPVSRREFWDILTDLHMQGITIFVSTPYMDEAERCSRVGLLYRGRLIVCDSPHKVKQMVQGEVIELRPTDFRLARDILARMPDVLEVQTYGEMFHLIVENAQRQMPAIARQLEAAGIGIESIRQTRARMEEAFISLIRREAAENGADVPEDSEVAHGR
jgi:ABC-2 type transport system ATP-binding protein